MPNTPQTKSMERRASVLRMLLTYPQMEESKSEVDVVTIYNAPIDILSPVRVSRNKAQRARDAASRKAGFARCRAYADKQISEFLSQKLDWSAFEPHEPDNGKVDAVYLLRKAYGSLRNPLAAS